jgi:hypothetical protein
MPSRPFKARIEPALMAVALAALVGMAACSRGSGNAATADTRASDAAASPAPSPAPPAPTQSGEIDPAWLSYDAAARTVSFHLVAGLTGLNGALNFNGFRDGGLALTVPRGWTVTVRFTNHDGMLPHSAEVIPETHPVPTEPVPPVFDGAFTVKLAEGLPPLGEDTMRFVADKVGSFLIFCGVPGHGAAGMWVRLKVSGTARAPSLTAAPAGKS